jgi:hypothetical protein
MNIPDQVEEYRKALGTYERMLAFEMDSVKKSNIQIKMGDIHFEFARQERSRAICESALGAYQKALAILP